MSEMVERAAKAIETYLEPFDEVEMMELNNSNYQAMARAAIEAMREPTENMLNVVYPPMNKGIWQRAIDEALK